MASSVLPLVLGLTGVLGAGASIASGAMQSSAAKTAADEQTEAENNALNFQEQVYGQQQATQAPFVQAGTQSLGTLMQDINNGTFGPGSTGAVPQFSGTFTAPTLAQAEQQPGYRFALQQGDKGILQGAAAGGGAISGGTLKALDSYNQNAAETDYSNVFNQQLQTYGAGVTGYQQQLAAYQQQLAQQQQAFSQLYTPIATGEAAASSINATGTAAAQNVGQLMSNVGASQAAGTIGSTNAIAQGLTGATSSLSQSALLAILLGNGGLGGGSAPTASASTPTASASTLGNLGLTSQTNPADFPLSPAAPNISYGVGPG
jgi:hypothetical protein